MEERFGSVALDIIGKPGTGGAGRFGRIPPENIGARSGWVPEMVALG